MKGGYINIDNSKCYLHEAGRTLLVIDVQKEMVNDYNRDAYNKCLEYVNNNVRGYDSIIVVWFQNQDPDFWQKHIHWQGCLNSTLDESVEIDTSKYRKAFVHKKTTYSVGDSLVEFLHNADLLMGLDVIGCNADACFLATCFKLFDARINFQIKTDLIFSGSKEMEEHGRAILNWEFGDMCDTCHFDDEQG